MRDVMTVTSEDGETNAVGNALPFMPRRTGGRSAARPIT